MATQEEEPQAGGPQRGQDLRPGLAGDIDRLFSHDGTKEGKPTLWGALERVITRPGPTAVVLYRASHQLWNRGFEFPAELIGRINHFLTGADIHPAAEIGGGFRLTHTTGIVIGRGARIGARVTMLHGVTLGGSARGWFDGVFEDGYPEVGDETEIMAGAKILGPIRVGRGCFVGANAVLAHDLGDGEAYTPGRQVAELTRRVRELEERLAQLQGASEADSATPDPSQPE